MRNRKQALLTLNGCLAAASLYAAFPLVVDDAATVAPGEGEVSFFYEFIGGSDETWHAFPVEISYGIHPRADLGVSTGYQILNEDGERGRGLLDTIVALKGLIFEQGDTYPFALTIEGSIKLPTASSSRGLGSGDIDLGVNLAATREWTQSAIDFNAGYLFAEQFGGRQPGEDEWFLGTAVRYATTETVEIFTEVFTEIPVSSGDPIFTLRAGANWEFRDGVFIGAAIGPAFGSGAADIHATGGLICSF